MAKSKIPVYDIYGIIPGHTQQDLLLSRFGPYVQEHRHLHTQHGHSFYHLVLFTKGSGEHTIDFDRFTVQPYQVYFMVPGQVHSWHFNGDMEGYLLGKTAGEVIRDRVLLEAKRLLVNEALTITEIAYALDFQDNSYFNRFFRKNTGMTPEAFRKQVHH